MARKKTTRKRVTKKAEVAVKGTKLGKQGAIIKAYDFTKPEQMSTMALTLATHVKARNLSTNIKGKNYSHVEGWQFAGSLLGMRHMSPEDYAMMKGLAYTGEPSRVRYQDEQEIRYSFTFVIVNADDKIVGRGSSMASSEEKMGGKKRWTDEYAIEAMAQTRTIGRAYRNTCGWIMNLAGYETVPTEEVTPDMRKDEVSTFDNRLKKLEETKFSEAQLNRQLQALEQEENLTEDQKKKVIKVINKKLKNL